MLASAHVLFFVAAAAAGLKIDHDPPTCVVKDRFVQLDASIDPVDDVMKARLYFKSAEDPDYYFVDMALMQGRFIGKLPKPKEKSGPITYFIEALGWKDQNRRSAEFTAQIIARRDACVDGAKVAAEGSGDDVRVTSTSSSRLRPQGFKGVASVTVPAETAASSDSAAVPDTTPPAKASTKPEKADEKRAEKRAQKPVETPAEQAPAPKPVVTPTPAPKSPPEDDYQIGAQDILKITVFGHEDLTQSVIVQNDGTFFFSLIGRVKGSDMSPKELERKLTTLLAQGYLRNPQVTVAVQEYRSKNIFVMGEVSKPGPLPYTGNMTVMQMLAQVGATGGAGSDVMILRPLSSAQQGPLSLDTANADPANKQAETIRVSIREIQMGQLDKNILLKPNDTVFVTQAAKVYLLGEIRNPGPQTYVSGLTIRQAITNAGGFTQDASKGKIVIGRQVDGQFKEIKAKPEDPVEAGDTITVKAKLF